MYIQCSYMYYERIFLTAHARKHLSRIGLLNIYELVRNAKIRKKPRKEGAVGRMEVELRKQTIAIQFTIRQRTLYVITVTTR